MCVFIYVSADYPLIICANVYFFCIFAQKMNKNMEQKLVGREDELGDLNKYLNSGRSEFIAEDVLEKPFS